MEGLRVAVLMRDTGEADGQLAFHSGHQLLSANVRYEIKSPPAMTALGAEQSGRCSNAIMADTAVPEPNNVLNGRVLGP